MSCYVLLQLMIVAIKYMYVLGFQVAVMQKYELHLASLLACNPSDTWVGAHSLTEDCSVFGRCKKPRFTISF